MKTYKELQEKMDTITEGQETVGGASRSAHSDFGVHRIEHPEQLGRLNAFLNAFTQMEFLEPKSAIATIRHGGSFGTTPTHDLKQGFYRGDNIAEFNDGKGLELSIDVYQEDGGLYQMDAKIMPSTPASEDNL